MLVDSWPGWSRNWSQTCFPTVYSLYSQLSTARHSERARKMNNKERESGRRKDWCLHFTSDFCLLYSLFPWIALEKNMLFAPMWAECWFWVCRWGGDVYIGGGGCLAREALASRSLSPHVVFLERFWLVLPLLANQASLTGSVTD